MEDQEDERKKLEGIDDDDVDDTPQVKPNTSTDSDIKPASKSADDVSVFLTGIENAKTDEEDEYLQLKQRFLGDNRLVSSVIKDGEQNQGEMDTVVKSEKEQATELQEHEDVDDSIEPRKLTLNPGG